MWLKVGGVGRMSKKIDPMAGVGFGLIGSCAWAFIGAYIIDKFGFDEVTSCVFLILWIFAFILFLIKL